MLGTIFRLAWRLVVGAVAILLAYLTAFSFYPYLDGHFPLFVSLIILYVLIAYFIIPFLVRLWHVALRPRHLPHYAVSRDGWSSDPVNIAIVCRDEQQLRQAMATAGWFVADKGTLRNTLREGFAMAFNQPYPTAPFSKLFLFGRPQDIGFQIQTGKSAHTAPPPSHSFLAAVRRPRRFASSHRFLAHHPSHLPHQKTPNMDRRRRPRRPAVCLAYPKSTSYAQNRRRNRQRA